MKLRIALATAAALAASAAPAAAATDHSFTLSGAAPVQKWEGAADISHGAPVFNEDARTAVPCGSPVARPCETILFKVTEAGKFTATVTGLEGTGGTTDVDAYLYKSDESGAQGEKLVTAAASGPDSVTLAKATPGFYLLVADYYHSYNSGYEGLVKFTPSAPAIAPAPPAVAGTPPAPAPAPQPAAKPTAKKKPSCAAKAKKKFKGKKNAKKLKAALKKCKKAKKKK